MWALLCLESLRLAWGWAPCFPCNTAGSGEQGSCTPSASPHPPHEPRAMPGGVHIQYQSTRLEKPCLDPSGLEGKDSPVSLMTSL